MFTIRSKGLVHREGEEEAASRVNCWQIEVSEREEEGWLVHWSTLVQLWTWGMKEKQGIVGHVNILSGRKTAIHPSAVILSGD